MRIARHRLVPPSLLPSESEPTFRYRIGLALALALIGFVVWTDPARQAPAGFALAVALALDAVARQVAIAAARRTGVADPIRSMPSLVLVLGTPIAVLLCLLAGILILGTDRFPILACLLAGIVAMTALARLVMARSVLGIEDEDADKP